MFAGQEQTPGGEAAIGRIPVISASGKPLMPCKPAKAMKLLKSGKATGRWTRNGTFYIQLKFDPKSPIIHPPANSLPNLKPKDMKPKVRFDASYLAKIRKEAWRKKVWFKSLSRLERNILDLASKCVNKPKSPTLIDILAKIVVKIKKALMSPIFHLIEQVGRPLAKKISQIAKKWGNKTAELWVKDEGFLKYLTITDMNNIPGFRLNDTLPSTIRNLP